MNYNSLITLNDFFSRPNLEIVVPDFQRGYSWGKQQLNDLWEDLHNIRRDSFHYTGMLTLSKIPNSGSGNSFYVIDGQQRLTTLIILISELLKKVKDGIVGVGEKSEPVKKYLYEKPYGVLEYRYRFSYCNDDPSREYFKTKILELNSTGAKLVPQSTLYTVNLKAAKDFFAEKLQNLDEEEVKDIFCRVVEKLKFNEYQIDDMDEVYVTFETMNNRGKELSTLELLKNRLIYLSTLFATADSAQSQILREHINNVWKTIYAYLGKDATKILDDDQFLRDHWIMYFRYDRSVSKAYKHDLLHEEFVAANVLNGTLTLQAVDDYVQNLGQSVEVWFYINCPQQSGYSDEIKGWLERLNHVGIGAFRPLIMSALQCDGIGQASRARLLKACEDFRFKISCISGRRSNTSDTRFYRLANDLFWNGIEDNPDHIAKTIEQQTDYWMDVDGFIKSMQERYAKMDGFYGWSGTRYLLYEYERELQGENDVKVDWLLFEENHKNKVTIEHIYPQTDTDAYWQARFTNEGHRALRHSLGNLLLLSQVKNSEAQNDAYGVKRALYQHGSHSEIDVAANYSEWTPAAIIQRGMALLLFIEKHWSISFSEAQKQKLLNAPAGLS